jgi:hypothetical protein
METLFEIIEKYGNGKGEAVMWRSIKHISDAVEKNMDESAKKALNREIYSEMVGGHYNETLAMEDVKCMYYIDEDGKMVRAPYWTAEQVKDIYDTVRKDIPDYNEWDFFVTMNMVASDNMMLLERWFPTLQRDMLDKKMVEMSINWLTDDDLGNSTKIWDYINSMK